MYRASIAVSGLLALILTAVVPASAATWYADPVNGSPSGDGSAANPWPTLKWIIDNKKVESMKPKSYPYAYGDPLVAFNVGAPVQPGDTIELLSGDHGAVYAQGYFNPDWVTLRAAAGHTPVVQRFQFRGGRKWRIDGVTVSQEPYATPGTDTAVDFENHSWHGPTYDCIIENCHIYSVDNTRNFTADDWLTKTFATGVNARGPRTIVRHNTIRNIKMGIIATADDCLIETNTLIGIGHDGLRSSGDRIVWQYNRLSDFVNIDDNHDDGLQMYRPNGVPHVGVVIRGNVFDSRVIPGRPLSNSTHGIGCFDGPYVDCIVANNVVLNHHYHGITLSDAQGCIIVNNTSLDPTRTNSTGIRTPDRYTVSRDNIIRNNLSYVVQGPNPAAGNISDHNITLTDALSDTIFVDWRTGDVRLAADSPAIDAGSADLAPDVDVDLVARPQGEGYDIGAYEYVAAAPLPGDADNDGDVDLDDFALLKTNFGAGPNATWGQGDFDGDGDVDLDDFAILKTNFGAAGR